MLDAKNTKDFPHFSLRQVNANFESEITKRKISTFDFPFFHFINIKQKETKIQPHLAI